MGYAYFSILGEDGNPVAVHAHVDHVPPNSLPISREQAVAISQARRMAQPAKEIIKPDMTQLEIMKVMADELVALKAKVDALSQIEVISEVSKT